MLKYYDEALNTFVMELSFICAKIERPSTNYINAALINAYQSPESSGIIFDSENKLVNYKWALVCIALEIAKTKKHDATLREVGVKRSLQAYKFDQLTSMFMLDTIGVMQSSLISDKTKNSAFIDLYDSQIFADFYLFSACSNYDSLRPYISKGMQISSANFNINLMHADLNVFNIPDERTRNEYSSIFDIMRERSVHSEKFKLGEGSVENFVTKNFKKAGTVVDSISKHTLKQILLLIYTSYEWPENILLQTIKDKNSGEITFAPYLANEVYVITPSEDLNTNHLKNGLSMSFISKIPNNDERFSYVRILARSSSQSDQSFKDLLSDLTIDNAQLCPWLVPLVANIANVPLFTKIIRTLAKSGVSYQMHTLDGVDCYVEPEIKYQIFAELINLVSDNKESAEKTLDEYLTYAFSYLKCYAASMSESAPQLNDGSSSLAPELLVNYTNSIDKFAEAIALKLSGDVCSSELFSVSIRKIQTLAAESYVSNIGEYITEMLTHNKNKQTIQEFTNENDMNSSVANESPAMIY